MKAIDTLDLKGFQSHRKTWMNFCPGLNIITGASDSGKTAIIRALKWALYNQPSGEEFINTECGRAEVSVLFIDGSQVIRVRGKGENYYTLYQDDLGGEKYQGFGINAPTEVQLLSRMHTAQFGDQEILLSFGLQLDTPFLLSQTGGAAARILGKLANTEDIDMAAKDVNGDLFRSRQEKSTMEILLEKVEKSIESYAWLEDAIQQLSMFEQYFYVIEQLKTRIQELSIFQKNYIINKEWILLHSENIDALNCAKQLQAIIPMVEEQGKHRNILQGLLLHDQQTAINWGLNEGILLQTENVSAASERIRELEKDLHLKHLLENFGYLYNCAAVKLLESNRILENTECLHDFCAQVQILDMKNNKGKTFAILHARYVLMKAEIMRNQDKINQITILSTSLENPLWFIEEHKETMFALIKLHMEHTGNYGTLLLCSNEILQFQKSINSSQRQMKDAYRDMKICPVCQSEISETQINSIIGGM